MIRTETSLYLRRAASIVALATVVVRPDASWAQVPPDEAWRQADTEHFTLTFAPHLEPIIPRAAASAERAYRLLAERFVDGPEDRIQLLLTDHTDFSNGFATPVPFNRITIFVRPPMDGDNISYFDDWLELVIIHELTHTFHFDMTGALGRLLRRVFGRLPGTWPTFPSGAAPTWFVEGLATYFESALTEAGRVKGTWHDMVLRTAALEGRFFTLDQVSGSSPVWPDGNRPYVFGSAYLAHMAERYGEESMGGFADAVAGLWIPYRLNAAAHDAFGTTVTDSWSEWREEKLAEYEALASSLERAAPITRGEPVETAGRLAEQALVSPDGMTLAFSRSDGVDKTQIRLARADGSGARPLTRINGVASLSWTPDGELVFPQLDYVDGYHLTSDVYRAALDGSVSRITHGQRLTYPDVSPDGARLVAVQEGGGTNELVTVDLATGGITRLSGGNLDEHWAFPRWSPDGRRIGVVRWSAPAMMDVVVMSADGGEVRPLTRDRSLDLTPFWSPDGRFLLWSSDRTGIPNIFAAEVSEDSGGALRQVTNVLGGATHPSVDPNGGWIYFSSYHADGWHIERIPYAPGEWFDPQPTSPRFREQGAPASPADPPELGASREYSAAATLRPYYWSPLVAVAETSTDQSGVTRNVIEPSVGLQIEGSDLVNRHAYAIAGRLSIDGKRFSGGVGYSFSGLGNPTFGLSVSQSHDAASRSVPVLFPDSTIGEFFLLERERRALLSTTLFRRRARTFTALTLTGGVVRENLTLQELSGSDGPGLLRPERTFTELRVTLSGANTQVRPFSFSREDGVRAFVFGRSRRQTNVEAEDRGVPGLDRSFEEVLGEISAFKALGGPGFANHVLGVRASGGVGFGSGANAFHFDVGGAEGSPEAVSGFGLFGGTGILFPVRGYSRDKRFGRYAWTATAEYRFPIVLVDRGLGSFPWFFDRVYGSAFFDAGNAWGPEIGVIDNPRQSTLAAVGAELSAMMLPFYTGIVAVRFGVGVPLVEDSGPVAYVRVGNAF